MKDQRMLEIPRYFTANVWKLVLGIILVAAAVGLALDPAPRAAAIDNPERWTAPAMFALVGLPLIASNVRLLARRPPWLRATAAGIWFGGGPIIPWHEIKGVYEAGAPIRRYGYSVRTRAIAFSFHRTRTLFKLPSSLWLTTIAVGDVKVSVLAANEQPSALVFQLEAMRMKACGNEDGTVPGAAEVPVARVVPRS
jgi:hypothetical protein